MNKIVLATLITITVDFNNQTKAADPNLQNPRDHQHIADAQNTKTLIQNNLNSMMAKVDQLLAFSEVNNSSHLMLEKLNESIQSLEQMIQGSNLTTEADSLKAALNLWSLYSIIYQLTYKDKEKHEEQTILLKKSWSRVLIAQIVISLYDLYELANQQNHNSTIKIILNSAYLMYGLKKLKENNPNNTQLDPVEEKIIAEAIEKAEKLKSLPK